MFYSNNPVLDEERYQQQQEERPHIECDECHGYLYKEDDYYEAFVCSCDTRPATYVDVVAKED